MDTPMEHTPTLFGLKVLIVEDLRINQVLTSTLLTSWDALPVVVENGAQALYKIAEEKFDVILMDINMPEMDGYDTTRAIRSLDDPWYQKIPIFALTQIDTPEYIEEIYDCGMTGYIHSKPMNPEKLYTKLKNLLRK